MSEQKTNVPATAPQTAIGKFAKIYTDLTTNMAVNNGLQFNESQKLAIMSASQLIFETCKGMKISATDQLDKSNVNQQLFNLAVLGLNPNATPKECFFKINKNEDKATGNISYSLELGIEGDGHDTLVRKHGVKVKSLSRPYIVREGDDFTLPYFENGKMMPPTWKPKTLSGKALFVFYILEYKDGTVDYPMADRESVAKNLKAHINQNLMGAGEEVKNQVIDKIENMGLDEMLNDKSLRTVKCKVWNRWKKSYEDGEKTLISPAYASPHSRESMIIRKMRINALSSIPKSFDNVFEELAYSSTFDDKPKQEPNPQDALEVEYEEKANTTKIDSVIVAEDSGEVVENKPENSPVQPPKENEATTEPEPTPAPAESPLPDWLADD